MHRTVVRVVAALAALPLLADLPRAVVGLAVVFLGATTGQVLATNSRIIATTNASSPRSSAAAKPMNRRPCWLSAAAGLRSALSRNEPKTLGSWKVPEARPYL